MNITVNSDKIGFFCALLDRLPLDVVLFPNRWLSFISYHFYKYLVANHFANCPIMEEDSYIYSPHEWCLLQPNMTNYENNNMNGGNGAPTPPQRRNSLQQQHKQGGSEPPSSSTLESRFSHLFKAPQFLPPPDPFTQIPKTYPSKMNSSQQQSKSPDQLSCKRSMYLGCTAISNVTLLLFVFQ